MLLSSEFLALIGFGGTILVAVWNAGRKVESMQKDVSALRTSVRKLSRLSERVAKLEVRVMRSMKK